MSTDLLQAYFDDDAFQEEWLAIIQQRDKSLPNLKRITGLFIKRDLTLRAFNESLTKSLSGETGWEMYSAAFLQDMDAFASHYSASNSNAEIRLRQILTDLATANMGQRIEQLHAFLAQGQPTSRAGKQNNKRVPPENSAFIISLFTSWLDPSGSPYIYSPGLCKGLALLIKQKKFTGPSGLLIGSGGVEITTQSQHTAVSKTVHDLVSTDRKDLKIDPNYTEPYGIERFFAWLEKHHPIIDKSSDGEASLHPSSTTQQSSSISLPTIPDEPLAAADKPLLKQLIAELRHHILIDEAVIERIYRALLAGHVVLTGPPGTGKTELARLIPELLWQSKDPNTKDQRTTRTAYTTTLATATHNWSTHTLIGGIVPYMGIGGVSYRIQYGYLTEAILKNWNIRPDEPATWKHPQRIPIRAEGIQHGNGEREFRGQWLVIDEFNRAQIDIAFGEALTTLESTIPLRVPLNNGCTELLPIPRDFRILGTLNSFDRNYLNQISEALKRRFRFVEILPPSRKDREAEQAIVLYKALKEVVPLDKDTFTYNARDGSILWKNVVLIERSNDTYQIAWEKDSSPERSVYKAAWDIFEIIRIYRQLGTAQAIALIRHMLIMLITAAYDNTGIKNALDVALCDTIADQLQVLMPDELDAIIWSLRCNQAAFIKTYNQALASMVTRPRRLNAQLEALGSVVDDSGKSILPDEEREKLLSQEMPRIEDGVLTQAFHLRPQPYAVPEFIRRLRAFKVERGL